MDSPALAGLIFPGQGTQYPGMGKPWRDTASWSLVDEISEHSGHDVAEIILDLPREHQSRTDLAQLAVFAISAMAHHAWLERHWPVTVIGYAGHSLGEYAALCAAGVVDLATASWLIGRRGAAMRQAARERPGTMAVLVGGRADEVSGQISNLQAQGAEIWVANDNAPGQVVVSGTIDAVEGIARQAPEWGCRPIRIPVGGAFHTPLMSSAAADLAAAWRQVTIPAEHPTVIANVDARPYTWCDWADLEVRQLVSPVRWRDTIDTMVSGLGCGVLIELGPGKTLSGMARRIRPGTPAICVDSPSAARMPTSAGC